VTDTMQTPAGASSPATHEHPEFTSHQAAASVAAFVDCRLMHLPQVHRRWVTCWLAYRLIPTSKLGLAEALRRPTTSVFLDLALAERRRKANKRFRERTDRLLDVALALKIGGGQ
jgi:hypothetical protein